MDLQWDISYRIAYTIVYGGERVSVGVRDYLKKETQNQYLKDDSIRLDLSISKGDWKQEFEDRPGPFNYTPWAAKDQPEFPTFELNLGTIYYFLTTNLLLPGRKVIEVDTSPSGGLRIPRDFYIVGNVVKK